MIDQKKIRVAMYFPFFLPAYGGAELSTFNLTRELRDFCDVKIYTYNYLTNSNNEKKYGLNLSCGFPEQEMIDGIPINRYSVTNLPILKNFSLKLIKDLRYSDINIIHFQGLPRLFSRLLLQKVVDNKITVMTTHGIQEALKIIRRNKFYALINPFFIDSLKKIDQIIAVTKTDVRLLTHMGINRNKITLIPNGIDEKKFNNRRRYVERNGKMKILCVARFDINKNYETLVSALSKLKNDLEFDAYFIGELTNVNYFKKIIGLIKKNGLEKHIKIGLSLDDPALVDCYLSCDLFVLPSTVETFGLVVLEAMYAGLPIIATPVGCVPEIIRNGVNGYVVPKNDPIKLYQTCLKLIKNEYLRNQMGNINKKISSNYTWSKVALSTYNLYQQFIMRER